MRSRVMPGSLVTMERRVPVRRLKRVDLPTLGRPTITRDGVFLVIDARHGTHRKVRRDADATVTHWRRSEKRGKGQASTLDLVDLDLEAGSGFLVSRLRAYRDWSAPASKSSGRSPFSKCFQPEEKETGIR